VKVTPTVPALAAGWTGGSGCPAGYLRLFMPAGYCGAVR